MVTVSHSFTSQEELRGQLRGSSRKEIYQLLLQLQNELNLLVESSIEGGENQKAIFHMSQLVCVEDEIMRVERELLSLGDIPCSMVLQ